MEDKARREIIDVCGVRGPAYDDLSRLPYLQAVLSESLRLYPSVPEDMKTASGDDTWPDGTFVPRGSTVVYDIYRMGRNQQIWGCDAEMFRPERWLDMQRFPDNYEYPVFNAGPRECLGRRMAQMEMKICLATLIPRISFSLAIPPSEILTDLQLTIGMARGLPCFVTSAPKQTTDSCASTTISHEEMTTRSDSLDQTTCTVIDECF